MPTRSSVGEWKIKQRLAQAGEALREPLLGDVVEEFALDAERPPGELHLDLALFADRRRPAP